MRGNHYLAITVKETHTIGIEFCEFSESQQDSIIGLGVGAFMEIDREVVVCKITTKGGKQC